MIRRDNHDVPQRVEALAPGSVLSQRRRLSLRKTGAGDPWKHFGRQSLRIDHFAQLECRGRYDPCRKTCILMDPAWPPRHSNSAIA